MLQMGYSQFPALLQFYPVLGKPVCIQLYHQLYPLVLSRAGPRKGKFTEMVAAA